MERAGFKVIAYNEFKAPASATHEANFSDSKALKAPGGASDITKVPDEVFAGYKGKVDLIFAGFPCQGFSKAGKKNAQDPRNQMYLQFVRAVKVVRPKFFIGENVTGLLAMKSGPAETDPPVIDLIRKAFIDIGYDLTYQILEATDFGVPQKRKRLVLIGWDTVRLSLNPASLWASVSAAGAKMPRVSQASFVTPSMEGAFLIPPASMPEGFANYALPVEQDVQPTGDAPHPYVVLKTNQNLLSCSKRVSPIHSEIIDIRAPSKTIICTYDHQPRLLVGLRKPDGTGYARTLLPDELKQIQGFPATFRLTGNKKDQVVQVGNAVPPPMIHAVAASLLPFV